MPALDKNLEYLLLDIKNKSQRVFKDGVLDLSNQGLTGDNLYQMILESNKPLSVDNPFSGILEDALGSVHTLNVSGNPIGDEGVYDLAASLVKNKNIVNINLSNTGMGPEGANVLASIYLDRKEQPLKSIDLSGNKIGGVESLALERESEKEDIRTKLPSKKIEDLGAKNISFIFIGKNPDSDLAINLEGNNFNEAGVKLLAKAVKDDKNVDLAINVEPKVEPRKSFLGGLKKIFGKKNDVLPESKDSEFPQKVVKGSKVELNSRKSVSISESAIGPDSPRSVSGRESPIEPTSPLSQEESPRAAGSRAAGVVEEKEIANVVKNLATPPRSAGGGRHVGPAADLANPERNRAAALAARRRAAEAVSAAASVEPGFSDSSSLSAESRDRSQPGLGHNSGLGGGGGRGGR